jgi:hypothetical protein
MKGDDDHFERIVREDFNRVYSGLRPRCLLLLAFVDFWIDVFFFTPLLIATFRGSWRVRDRRSHIQ